MNDNNEKKEASTIKYIVIGFVWSCFSFLFITIYTPIHYNTFGTPVILSSALITLGLMYFINATIPILLFVLIYQRFEDIKIRKVMVFLYVISALHVGGEIINKYELLSNDRIVIDTFVQYSIILSLSFVYFLLSIKFYFKNKPQWGE